MLTLTAMMRGSFSYFMDCVEHECAHNQVYLDSPEFDNSMYVVDLRRWRHVDEEDQTGDSLNDEWEQKENA